MKCPHCSNEISDTARFCDNCGEKIALQEPEVASLPKVEVLEAKTERSEIQSVPPNIAMGIFWSLLLVGMIPVTLVSFLLFALAGIVSFVITLCILAGCINAFTGSRKTICPHCQHLIGFSKTNLTIKCFHCKKINTIVDGYLYSTR